MLLLKSKGHGYAARDALQDIAKLHAPCPGLSLEGSREPDEPPPSADVNPS